MNRNLFDLNKSELDRKGPQVEGEQDKNLTERRRHWRWTWWSMVEFKLPMRQQCGEAQVTECSLNEMTAISVS